MFILTKFCNKIRKGFENNSDFGILLNVEQFQKTLWVGNRNLIFFVRTLSHALHFLSLIPRLKIFELILDSFFAYDITLCDDVFIHAKRFPAQHFKRKADVASHGKAISGSVCHECSSALIKNHFCSIERLSDVLALKTDCVAFVLTISAFHGFFLFQQIIFLKSFQLFISKFMQTWHLVQTYRQLRDR